MKHLLLSSYYLTLAFSPFVLSGASTVDFDPTGEFSAQFSGGIFTESATGGLNDSVGLTLQAATLSTFDGSQSESYSAAGFADGSSFTVGAFFNLSSLGTGQVFRLGLTNGGADNFANLPFSTFDITNATTGAAEFVVRDALAAVTPTFTLATEQWYYFETTFTRGVEKDLTYDMLIAIADTAGTIGATLESFSHFQVTDGGHQLLDEDLNGELYGAFKGETAFGGSAAGVLDNFYVSVDGISQVPEPAATSLLISMGMLGLIFRRRFQKK